MRSFIASILMAVSFSVSAAEYREVKVTEITDLGVVSSPKGCTTKRGGVFGGKKTVDCFGIILRGVSGTNKLGKTETLGDVVLFPAGLDRQTADGVANLMVAYLEGKLAEGVTLQFSNLRYIDSAIPLSVVSKDAADTKQVKLGGISLYVKTVQKDGNIEMTNEERISVGLN